MWNGKDPILKERLFGLTGSEVWKIFRNLFTIPLKGNHGEDCKELYYYLESTPTHSYMRGLYKYPHAGEQHHIFTRLRLLPCGFCFLAYPYSHLVHENQGRSREAAEFEVVRVSRIFFRVNFSSDGHRRIQ